MNDHVCGQSVGGRERVHVCASAQPRMRYVHSSVVQPHAAHVCECIFCSCASESHISVHFCDCICILYMCTCMPENQCKYVCVFVPSRKYLAY